jgi:hypothetical protein
MLRLPLNERRRRWAEYLVRLSRLEAGAKREKKKKPAARRHPLKLMEPN